MLDGVETNRSARDAIADAGGHIADRKDLHQPQNLNELTLASSAHERLEKSPRSWLNAGY
jgi:hypothetical protein